jgi:hypothetical protein
MEGLLDPVLVRPEGQVVAVAEAQVALVPEPSVRVSMERVGKALATAVAVAVLAVRLLDSVVLADIRI